MSLAATNATLLRVEGGGTSEDYDTPAGGDAVRWESDVGAYVVDELVRSTAPGRVDEIRKTSLVVPARVGRMVRRGDTIVFRYQGTDHQRAARDVRVTEIAGTARIALEDA